MFDEDGIGLVEVLVAILIISLVAVSVLGALLSTTRANATTQRQSEAYTLASQAIAQIQEDSYSGSWLASSAYPTTAVTDSGTPVSSSFIGTNASGGSTFTSPGGQTENLVTGGSGSGIAPVSYVNVQTGQTGTGSCTGSAAQGGAGVTTGQQCATVERFITWAPQSCKVLNASSLTNLVGTLDSAQTTLSTLSTTLTNLFTGLHLLSSSQLGSFISTVLGDIGDSTGTTTATLNSLLTTLESDLSSLITPLSSVTSSVGSLVAELPLTNVTNLDLCSMPDVDLAALSSVSSVLTSTNAILASSELQDLSSAISSLTNPGCVASFTSCLSSISSSLTSALSGLLTGVGCLLNPTGAGCPDTVWAALDSSLSSLVTQVTSTGTLTTLTTGLASTLTGGCTVTFSGTTPTITYPANGNAGSCGLLGWLLAPASEDNTEQSKRLTVAVILPKGPTTAQDQTVWESTLITDPSAGLL